MKIKHASDMKKLGITGSGLSLPPLVSATISFGPPLQSP
jgi:hypothetical protein